MTSSSNLFANDPLWRGINQPWKMKTLNGLNGKPKVQILLQEHSRITIDSVSVGFDNKTTRAEQEEPHQLDVETLPSSRDSGGHGRPLASSYGSKWFFFVTASFWLHFYPCWSWCAYSFIPFILGVENFEPSPSKTSHHFPHQNCWTLWETGRDLIWSDEMPLLKPDVKPQNEARFDHFASTQGMIFTIYNQQPLGHWGLIPR